MQALQILPCSLKDTDRNSFEVEESEDEEYFDCVSRRFRFLSFDHLEGDLPGSVDCIPVMICALNGLVAHDLLSMARINIKVLLRGQMFCLIDAPA